MAKKNQNKVRKPRAKNVHQAHRFENPNNKYAEAFGMSYSTGHKTTAHIGS